MSPELSTGDVEALTEARGHWAHEGFPDADHPDMEHLVCKCGLPWSPGVGCVVVDGTRSVVAEVLRETAERADGFERLAQHLVSSSTWPGRCELTARPGTPTDDEPPSSRGRCPGKAVAVRWEDGFTDAVCVHHADDAHARGALTVRIARAAGA